ncbi:hypothetical protein FHS26_004526 [Rhizobium pisi]|uniref:DUF2125 domain-containing protein n=1 Tax=Rhizobium pisi TaxID=574561 RepID=A0A427MGE3_9HYPH|nr:hypothetical protein [Rhizobium pisi]MBB3136769.1 hypothetical protein [Rhizobium pisi]RSB66997.1 hypothetical protein EFD55_21980 [Rhizobium pisi]
MRFKLITATCLLALGLFTTADAVEINQDGANAVRDNLAKLLSKELAKSGLVTVNPAGTRYEIIYDLAKLFARADPATTAINGSTSFSTFATPLENGLWDIKGDDSLDMSVRFIGPDRKQGEFSLSLESFAYGGVFDPAINFLRSSTYAAKKISLSSKFAAKETSFSFADANYSSNFADSAGGNGRVDLVGNGSTSGFFERISDPGMPPVEIRADSIDVGLKANAVPLAKLIDTYVFVMEHDDEEEYSRETHHRVKELLTQIMPLFSSFNETVGLDNPTVTSQAGLVRAKTFGYDLAVDGSADAVRFGFGVNAQEISLDSSLVPASYSALLPTSLNAKLAVPNMNFAAFGDLYVTLDFDKPTPEGFGEKGMQKLFPDGEVTIDVPKVNVRSDIYDFDISGEIKGRVDGAEQYSMEATILARDLDKTITALQGLAKTDPDLSQVSFGLMMAKGFAKTDPDGRSRWDISIGRGGSVVVNGQVIKAADQP